ncbi:molybdopterin-dependent oxidoreductase [Adlercreutzia equolifaciens]|uniref:molybdopterin-dependent oxidoreductase n=1 Tax=Adlercreutzia equolifaciens TaxID=446660 RepID=UPI0023B13955|nr:molybdopterin-dependent oxidoreductase [Adlercreutzia equolifaciens]MDE8701381.1 molybdopterin-dependent oxidoreductase [Adlercreutzia equolifaciens]
MKLCRKPRAILAAGVMATMLAVALTAGCSPNASPQATSEEGAGAASATAATEQTSKAAMFSPKYNPDGPVITQEENGTLIERTPVSGDDYNVKVLDADVRGCYACHGNLNELMLSYYPQHNPSQGLEGVNPTISQCLDCHNRASYAGNLGGMLHAIHNVETDGEVGCFNCHSTTVEGGLALWDQVKYDELKGITPVEDVNGTFTFDQDLTVSQDQMPNAQWLGNDYDLMRFDNTADNKPLDQEMFDTWEISITGAVAEEKTWKLVDLIDEAEKAGVVVTTPLVAQCTINPLGGEAIAQVEVTGIPLEWLLEKVDINDDAVGAMWYTPDGERAGYRGVNLDELPGHTSLLAYQFNGEPLSWNNGYPCALWIGGICADHISKNFAELRISDEDHSLGAEGVPFPGEGTLQSSGKPNLGFMNTLEGTVIQAGQPFTFEGWANGFDVPVTALEFSMDGGETWQRCETPNIDNNRWIHWQYEFTPAAENGDTAYVLCARAIDATGRVTPTPIKVMVNAKTEMPQPTN